MKAYLRQKIEENIALKQAILEDSELLDRVEEVIHLCVQTFQNGQKVLFCGNGGSAADAQHLAAELSGRFYLDRAPLAAEALNVNTAFMTAISNDYNFEMIFARMLQALGQPGDVLFALSTSGNSPNIVKVAEMAQELSIPLIGMTGASGGALKPYCSILLNMPATDTPRIQEAHMLLGHLICDRIEAALFTV